MRVFVGAAVGRENTYVLALRRWLALSGRLRGLRDRQRNKAIVRHAGAAGEQHGERRCDAERALHLDCRLSPHDPPTLRYLTTSICSGTDASIIGPWRCSTQPRTLILRPTNSFGSMPAAAKSRR